MKQIVPLNETQLASLDQVTGHGPENKPARFLANGQAANIRTGVLCSKGSNIMYHPVYWDRPKSFLNDVLIHLSNNNPDVKFTITFH